MARFMTMVPMVVAVTMVMIFLGLDAYAHDVELAKVDGARPWML